MLARQDLPGLVGILARRGGRPDGRQLAGVNDASGDLPAQFANKLRDIGLEVQETVVHQVSTSQNTRFDASFQQKQAPQQPWCDLGDE